MKIICFGARKNEQAFFNMLNKYNYQLTLVEELLTKDNVDLVKDHNVVLLRGNCYAKDDNLLKMREFGVEYLLTRTVGFDHIDVVKAKELGFKLARVPSYSPNAIAELGLSLAMMLVRNTADTISHTKEKDFTVYPSYFSREIRFLTVGIVGTGKIGLTSARLYKGLGSNVIGFDPYPNPNANNILSYTASLDDLLSKADIVVMHMPYIKGENDNIINASKLALMKNDAILVNMARGEIVDTSAVVNALKSNKLAGFATDVLRDEASLFNKKHSASTGNSLFDELVAMHPRVLITPHIGSNTDEACRNMIEQSFDNLNDFLTTGKCSNEL